MNNKLADFQHCIWYQPNKEHIWNTYCDHFEPHMSIVTNNNKNDSIQLYNSIKSTKIYVKLIGNIIQSCKPDGFYALYYRIEPISNDIPSWWPKNAHISFAYRYNIPFSDKEIAALEKKIAIRYGLLENIHVVNCSKHYLKWQKLN